MTERDYDKELVLLKEKIEKVVGVEKIKSINEIIEISYKYDEKPN